MSERMFTVFIRRVETYDLPVNVLAASKEQAENLVRTKDAEDLYNSVWNELQPSVETAYEAAPADEPERGEGPMA